MTNTTLSEYNYKIKWLFPVAEDLFKGYIKNRADLYKAIRALHINSLDKINFLDSQGKVIKSYSDNTILSEVASIDAKAIYNIRKTLKENKNIYYVELLRK